MRYRRDKGGGALDSAFTWLAGLLVAAGIALRLWQYLGQSALWSDEATIANNIVARDFADLLLHPLANNQAAPIGFLLIEKVAASLFGPNELALRAYPMLCGVVSLLLLWSIGRRLLPPAGVALVLILRLRAAVALLCGRSEAVLERRRDRARAAARGAAALGSRGNGDEGTDARGSRRCARGVVFAAGGARGRGVGRGAPPHGGHRCAENERGRRRARRIALGPIAVVVGVWGVSALGATLVSLHHLTPASQHYMRVFWSDGFWPLSLVHPSSLAWPIERVAFILGNQLDIPTSVGFACALLAATGVLLTARKNWRSALLLLAPIVVAIGASAAHLYPFGDRLALFLVPSLLLLATIGLVEVAARIPAERGAQAVLVGAGIFLLVVEAQALHAGPPVYRREEITPVLAYLRQKGTPTDAGYVYYGAVPAYTFYDFGAPFPARATMGGCHRGDSRAYLTELDALRGRPRVWLLFAHESWKLGERELMLRYLDAIGTARDSMVASGRDVDGKQTRVRLYLYDLSDSAKLDAERASTVAIPEAEALEERKQCAPTSE